VPPVRNRRRRAPTPAKGSGHPGIKPIGATPWVYWGLFGGSSAGKTTMICTLEDSLIIKPPIEHTNSVKNPAKGVKEWTVSSWSEMNDEVLQYLMEHGKDHAFVWLDSASGWQDVGLDEIWQDTIAAKPERKKTQLDKLEYNKNFVRLSQWVRAVVGMQSFNFGFTAWPETLEDPNGNTTLMPWIQGKNMANRFVGYMNLVTYLERVKDKNSGDMKRVLRIAESDKYFTKDQFGLPERIVSPTVTKVMEAIEASRTQSGTRSTPRRRTRRTTTRKGSSK
jgi:hypothetical protein